MKVLLCFLIAIHASQQACLDQQATVQIQNFECPIYVHPPSCDQRRPETYECTCVKQPNYGPGLYNTGTYSGVDQKCPDSFYNTGMYLGVDQKCHDYNAGSYVGAYYPQTGVEKKFCYGNDVRKSCPKTVEIDTTLMYDLPQSYQNRQTEFKCVSYL
nr:uncharacterized protein LOC128680232 isoform X3 [Plodia interpunctella]